MYLSLLQKSIPGRVAQTVPSSGSAGVVLSLHPLPLTFILLFLLLTASCRGRCGGEYYRGYRCQCDYSCLSYGECCNDYESQCTTSEAFSLFGSTASSRIEIFAHHYWTLHIITSNNQPCSLTVFVCLLWCLCATENSCKGRCGENFKRGRLCSCDSDCATYDQCCPDYKNHCDAQGRSFLAHSCVCEGFLTHAKQIDFIIILSSSVESYSPCVTDCI